MAKFDITWVKQARPEELKGGEYGEAAASAAEEIPAEAPLLKAFGKRKKKLHVIELAKESGEGFDETLRDVLHLVADGYLEIERRDEVAGDHLVRLTERGEEVAREA